MPTASPTISMLPSERPRRQRASTLLGAALVQGARRVLSATLVLSTALWCCIAAAQAGPPVTIERSDPRLFAYQLGDVISEQITLRLAPGVQFDASSLPRAGKRAGWFTVRDSEVHTSPLTDGGSEVSVRLDVQLVNSPTTARTLTVPPVALRFKAAQPFTDTIPGLTIDAVPLGTGEVRSGLPDVRGARPAPLVDTRPFQDRLHMLGIAAAALACWVLASLLLRWLRPASLRPFAAAQRDLRRLLRAAGAADGAREAVQRLHRAFDQAAGQRLFGPGVPSFCHRMGADADLERRTVAFFTASQALFFDTGAVSVPAGLARDLGELCSAWKRFERRHA